MRDFNTGVIAEFRSNEGRVGGFFEGAPLVLLHTKGAKTAQERINPLMCLHEDGTVYVFASKGGDPRHPDWYHNLLADSHVTVETGHEVFEATARVLGDPERARVYSRQAELFPRFDEYQQKTERLIPVVALDRVVR
ncbi:MAG: nitroreductase family deazaflavin-dependent oxidoreductase [Acidimicrobiales bacterium]